MIKYTYLYNAHATFLVLLILASLTSQCANPHTPLMLGSMQFPQTVESIPVPSVYWMGKKIPCEVHDATKKVTFDFPKGNKIQHFYILATESISYQLKKSKKLDQQTIDYIKVDHDQHYKLYKLSPSTNINDDQTTYVWNIQPINLNSQTRRIPDATIIVLCNPDYIKELEGGNELTLPTIVMQADMVERAGSQEKLQENAIVLQLASLDTDTIHAPLKHVVKNIGHRTLIAPTT
ncbi:MAG TPA: hypothetical protein PLU71_04370 [Candidatus Dependentiae bacterium]|nr:hypothetical protein [Candidatus Dependentiae bacterium]HRQ63068.1 hypothetical protein [Candidatus Dependentiae bacterium]